MLTPAELNGGNFPIGVDAQPIGNLATWAARGCNLAVRADLEGGTKKIEDWAATAAKSGLKTIREPGDAGTDRADNGLLAVAMPDEADTSNHWYAVRPAMGWPSVSPLIKIYDTVVATDGRKLDLVGRDYGPIDPVKKTQAQTGATWQITAEAYALKAAAIKAARPNVAIFGNFAGNYVTQNDPRAQYFQFCAPIDFPSNDWHVIDKDPTPFGQPRRYQYWWAGWAAQRLTEYSGGKPAFAYIECSKQNRATGSRWPNTAELWTEVWAAIALGAAGIIYFPQHWGPFYADGVGATANGVWKDAPPDEVAAAKALLARIVEINSTIKRGNLYLTRGVHSLTTISPGVFYATWDYGGKTMAVAVNATTSFATINGAPAQPASAVVLIPTDDGGNPLPGPIPSETPTRAEFDAFKQATVEITTRTMRALDDGLDAVDVRIAAAAKALRTAADALDAIAKPASRTQANAASGNG